MEAARQLALASALDGMRRAEAACATGMDRQTLRDWVIRFSAEGVTGLRGPDPERDGVSAWRVVDLCRIAEERFGVACREGGMRRLVKSLNLSWQKTRPYHPKAEPTARERFRKGASPRP